jgi:hypothetical protein
LEHVSKAPLAGLKEVIIKRGREQRGRVAKLEIRFCKVNIVSPKDSKSTIPVTIIEAKEAEDRPNGKESILWYLLTTLKVETLEDAFQCVEWYNMRWLIERYHYVLKEGCKVEELQLEEASRLSKAIALYSIVAWFVMFMTYLNRTNPDEEAAIILTQDHLEALYHYTNKKAGTMPERPTVREVILMIARLAGFMGRKGDGQPGVKILWRGLRSLTEITNAYKIFVKNVGND